jgi:hypothetical protein
VTLGERAGEEGEDDARTVGASGAHGSIVPQTAADVNPSERNFCSGAPESYNKL